jgi:hypothetical protein
MAKPSPGGWLGRRGMPHGRIGHWANQRTDCFLLPLYPLTNIWSNGTV